MRCCTLLSAVGLLSAVLGAQAPGPLVAGRGGVVAGPEPHAVRAGIEVMEAGGSAVDAAVAVSFALAVTLPSAGNLGGGGFMVIALPDGRRLAVDYREMAPLGADPALYVDGDGKPVPGLSTRGHLAAAVPGTPAGLCFVQERYGRLSLARVLAPALRLAREGFPVSSTLAASLRAARRRLEASEESRRIFLAGGRLLREGEVLRQPELAAVLERIARRGRAGFYGGRTADLIVEEMRRGGGVVTHEDLARYVVKERAPVRSRYRGYGVVSMPPPSSGGVALACMLGILEGYPLGEWGPRSPRTRHVMIEAMRLAFRDRALHMGDPDFADVPAGVLASRAHADRLRARIRDVATPSEGMPADRLESEQTTHFSVMDREGYAVACTTTLNGSYGCGVTVTGAGFLLNNEMDDFAIAPGVPNMYGLVQGAANAVGPRKRPLSSMTPTLLERDGRVVMVIGSPGGPTIINTVLQCISNVVDHGMDVAEAVATPRIHHQWLPDVVRHEEGAFDAGEVRDLESRGHRLEVRTGTMGDAHGILVDPSRGGMTAAADPRHGGVALGW